MTLSATDTQVRLTWNDPATEAAHEWVGILPLTIGRDAENELVLNSDTVSRKHAQIVYEDEQVVIVDLNSRNGVWLNERPVERAPLQSGDAIRLGAFELTVVVEVPVVLEPAPPTGDATQIWTPAGHPERFSRPNATEVHRLPQTAGQRVLPPSSIIFDPRDGRELLPLPSELLPPEPARYEAFPPECFTETQVPVHLLERCGVPLTETVYLTLGGGLGSFAWVQLLLTAGARPDQIRALGLEAKPYARYEALCRNSQIPLHERLRSNADSCPDNIWGWPGYALREAMHALVRARLGNAARVMWQVFGEPTLAQTYTPKAGNVFASLEREQRRIGWQNIWRYGRALSIRKTDDGRYVVAYTQTSPDEGTINKLIIAPYVHIAVGYPGVQFLRDLRDYRERTGDFQSVVNAYEPHEHVYEHLLHHGGVVLLRGRGIVAMRVLQRLSEIRAQLRASAAHDRDVGVLHLLRRPVPEGNQYEHAQRVVEHHWEFQPFNWPKACWGGELRTLLEKSDDAGRDRLLNDWGGTTTAARSDWRQLVAEGLREGWYQIRFGEVEQVERDLDGRVVTTIRGKGAIADRSELLADFVIDCTGLEASIDDNPLLKDLTDHYQLGRNPKGRLRVANDFELPGMANGEGRMYAAGAMTLGGPYAAVDSFLGLQYAALRSVDALTARRAPALRRITGLRSLTQWLRWAVGVKP